MRITQIYKFNIIALSVVCVAGVFAQNKQHKLSEKFAVNNDVTVHLNTSHTSVVFETWNKNTVGVEAYIEGDQITEENKERLLGNWQVQVLGNSKEVTIKSITGNFWSGTISATSNGQNKGTQEFNKLGSMITDMLGPILQKIENNPMPSALSENLASMNFDTNKYNKDEEKYIKQWGDQIREKFGDNSENVLKGWAKELQNNTVQVGPKMEIPLGSWEGGQFAQQMQNWSSQFSGDVQIMQRNGNNVTVYRYSSGSNTAKIDRVIKVMIPKEAGLRLNVRHGDVKLAEKAINVVASLAHTALEANVIDGDNTFIRASYSPVSIKQWNTGRLVINYVKNCRIHSARNLRVNADSSNLFIQELEENAAISGSFGAITVDALSESFSTLDLAVENSDFKLNLPETAFNLTYSGAQSRISLPKTVEANARRNFGNVFVSGFQDTRNTDKIITINAKYSDIVLK
ncbi:hypothetical protein GCM10022393_30590 [Aquimarina addita]|uniref:Adhesin domain-containing protein n=1 Tax=Aquimarina addita TaxID=870485 RepID=A0ABP6URE3_9FLAO